MGEYFHLYFFDIPLFVCLLFVIICYSGSIVVMRQAAGSAGNRLEKQVCKIQCGGTEMHP